MADKVRLAIVGTGGIAGSHLNGYKILADAGYDQFEIAALCDNNPDRLASYAAAVKEKLGVEPATFGSVEELVASKTVDAVDNCTPHAFHHTTAIPCIEAGLHVMIEKPGGVTIKATELIEEAQKKSGTIVAVAEQVRRGIKARCMKWALMDKKMIGDMRFFVVEGYSLYNFSDPNFSDSYAWQWRLQKPLTGGGMVFDGGAHLADMIRVLFGDVDEVSARTAIFQAPIITSPELGPRPKDVEDTWMSTLTFESGVFGSWSWSFSVRGEEVSNQMFYGADGSARDRGGWMHPFQNGGDLTFADGKTMSYEEVEREYRASLDDSTREALYPLGVEDDMALECWDFVDAIQKGRPVEVDIVEAKRAKSICLALYESAEAGGAPIKVKDVFDGTVSEYQDAVNEHWGI